MRRLLIVLGVLVLLVAVVVIVGWVALQRVDWNEYKQPAAAAALDATGRKLDLAGDLDLQIGLRPGVMIEDVGFENAPWGSRPEMVTAERIVVRLELLPLLFGDVVVDRVELVGLDVLLETRKDGTPNWQFAATGAEATPPPQPESEPLSALVREARIENALIVIRDAEGGEQRFAVKRLLATMDADALTLDLEGEYGKAPLQLSGSVTGVPQVTAGGPVGLDLKLAAGGARADLAGQVGAPLEGTGLDLSLRVAGKRLAELGAVAGSELPDLGPYALSLKLQGGGNAYAVRDLALEVGSSKITGKLDADLAGARPRIDAVLASRRIDRADFQAGSGESPPSAGKADTSAPSDKVFSADPLPLDGLGAADVALRLDVDALQADALALANVDLNLRLTDRRLRIEGLGAELAGGRFDLGLSLDGSRSTPPVNLSLKVRNVDAGRLASSQGSDALTGGSVDVDLQVAGQGASVKDIMGSLGGDLEVKMGNAVVNNEWAGIALSDVESTLRTAATGGGAKVECFLADFAIADGVARPEALVADLGSIALFGEGKVDLKKEKIKLSFDRQSQSVSASGALPPFQVKGTFANPEAGLDAGAVAGRVVDLGATLLGGKKKDAGTRAKGLGCRELYASYLQAKQERGSTAEVAIDAALGALTKGDKKKGKDDQKADDAKRVIEGFKGLLGR